MFEKIEEAVFAYCFGVLEIFLNFIERTHAVIGVGLPMVTIVAVHTFVGRSGDFALFMLVLFPASAAMGKMIVDCLVLSKRR